MACLRSCGELEEKPDREASAQGVLGQCSLPGIHFAVQEKILLCEDSSELNALAAAVGFCRGLVGGASSAHRNLNPRHSELPWVGHLWAVDLVGGGGDPPVLPIFFAPRWSDPADPPPIPLPAPTREHHKDHT